MAKYTTIKCWHLTDAITDPNVIEVRDPSLLIIKKSILKLGYRAFATDDRAKIEKQAWYPQFLMGDEVRFYIDGSGVYRLVNCDLTESELYFERLNVPLGCKPWIFYSWQSDHNPSRAAIKDALKEAVDHINDNLSPRQRLEIVESTRPEDGAKNIVDALKDNLNKSMFSIFDITNVAKVEAPAVQANAAGAAKTFDDEPKSYPNANVVFELSYALARKQPNQILLVKKSRMDVFKDDKVPFDFEHNKHHKVTDYETPAKLKAAVKEILIAYFRRANFIKID